MFVYYVLHSVFICIEDEVSIALTRAGCRWMIPGTIDPDD
jgi:hypothetical protein